MPLTDGPPRAARLERPAAHPPDRPSRPAGRSVPATSVRRDFGLIAGHPRVFALLRVDRLLPADPLSGAVGFLVAWVFVFLVFYWIVNRWWSTAGGWPRTGPWRPSSPWAALCMFTPLVLIVAYLFAKGAGLLSAARFPSLTPTSCRASQNGVEELCLPGFPCKKPGVLHAIVGTLRADRSSPPSSACRPACSRPSTSTRSVDASRRRSASWSPP